MSRREADMGRLALTPRFSLEGRSYALLADAAQEAEFQHAAHARVYRVTALVTEPECYAAGEVVYTSRGAS